MSLTRRQYYLGAWLIVAALLCGACRGKHTEIKAQPPSEGTHAQDEQQERRVVIPPRDTSHGFDKTEVDLEHGPLESASRYHRPHGTSLYRFDHTEVDLERGVKTTGSPQSR